MPEKAGTPGTVRTPGTERMLTKIGMLATSVMLAKVETPATAGTQDSTNKSASTGNDTI